MDEPELVFLQAETFQLHRELRMFKTGISENQMKTIRVLSTPELVRFSGPWRRNEPAGRTTTDRGGEKYVL